MNNLDNYPYSTDNIVMKRRRQVTSKEETLMTNTIVQLFEDNQRYNLKVQDLLLESMKAIVTALEERDPYTHGHSVRVMEYACLIGRKISLTAKELKDLELASLFHDLGKIGIPDHVLLKPGRLDPEEFKIMQSHPEKSSRIIGSISEFKDLIPIILHHHERFDGKGYPLGLKGDQIPIGARIILLADTYDAMTSSRAYRNALPREIAIQEIKDCKGTQFDPFIADSFVQALENGEDQKIIPLFKHVDQKKAA